MTWVIKPLVVGMLNTMDKSSFLYGVDIGKKIQAPVLVWLVKNNETNEALLVDVGAAPDAIGKRDHPAVGYTQDKNQTLKVVLEKEVDDLNNIKTVIITHLHWDHSWECSLFTNAEILIQIDEMRYAISPMPIQKITYQT